MARAAGLETTRSILPVTWLWLNLTNDLLWLLPFALILRAAYRHHRD